MKEKKKDETDLPSFTDADKFIHEPSRLLILSYLYLVESLDYTYIKNQLNMTFGNLSSHMNKLEAKEYIIVEKKFVGKRPITMLKLSETGKSALEEYRKKFKAITSI